MLKLNYDLIRKELLVVIAICFLGFTNGNVRAASICLTADFSCPLNITIQLGQIGQMCDCRGRKGVQLDSNNYPYPQQGRLCVVPKFSCSIPPARIGSLCECQGRQGIVGQ